jgi:4'-phosphopantetheinyl transferase
MMLDIFYTKLPGNNDEGSYAQLLGRLPALLQQQSLRYHQWQDRWRSLLGKLLLMDAMEKHSIPADMLDTLDYTHHGRPFFKDIEGIDFNISHSGSYVMCVIAFNVRTGIDIEEIKPQHLGDFANTMNEQQWQIINSSADPFRQFFTYWAIKESVIKADSRGLSLPLTGIHITGTTAQCDDHSWYLYPLQVDDNYCACLAADRELPAFEMAYREYA